MSRSSRPESGACSATVGVAAISYRWLERSVILAVRGREAFIRGGGQARREPSPVVVQTRHY
jgi:hypothetical protein